MARAQEEEEHEVEEEVEHVSHGARSNNSNTSRKTSAQHIAKRPLAQAAQLAYAKVTDARALEGWLRGMRVMFSQLGYGDGDDDLKLAEIPLFVDEDVERWWMKLRARAEERGEPIETWARFIGLLRKQFQPKQESQRAIEEFHALKQRSGEAMHLYTARADQLAGRLPDNRFTEYGMMQTVYAGVLTSEWPRASLLAMQAIQTEKVQTMTDLRELLQDEAMAEPARPIIRAQPKLARPASANELKHQQRRAATAQLFQQSEDEATESDEESAPGGKTVAPIKKTHRAPFENRCARCKKTDHKVADCKAKEDRQCYGCKEIGHILPNCPNKKSKKE